MSRIVLARGVKDTWIETDVHDMCSKTGQDCYVLPDDNVIDAFLDEPLVDKDFTVYSQRQHNSLQAPINSNYADGETASVLVCRYAGLCFVQTLRILILLYDTGFTGN